MPESEGRKAFLRKQFFRLLPVQILLIAIGRLSRKMEYQFIPGLNVLTLTL